MSDANESAKRRRANITTYSDTVEVHKPPPKSFSAPIIMSHKPGVQLPHMVANMDNRLNAVESIMKSVVSNNYVDDTKLQKHLQEYDHRFNLLVVQMNEIKEVVLKLQEYTLQVNKQLIERQIESIPKYGVVRRPIALPRNKPKIVQIPIKRKPVVTNPTKESVTIEEPKPKEEDDPQEQGKPEEESTPEHEPNSEKEEKDEEEDEDEDEDEDDDEDEDEFAKEKEDLAIVDDLLANFSFCNARSEINSFLRKIPNTTEDKTNSETEYISDDKMERLRHYLSHGPEENPNLQDTQPENIEDIPMSETAKRLQYYLMNGPTEKEKTPDENNTKVVSVATMIPRFTKQQGRELRKQLFRKLQEAEKETQESAPVPVPVPVPVP
jgi:hypothetical protein